jgi:hypothetical protein
VAAAAWLAASSGLCYWQAYADAHNIAGIICGYPTATGPAYDSCFAKGLEKASPIYQHVFMGNWYFIVVPTLALAALAMIIERRSRRKKLSAKA